MKILIFGAGNIGRSFIGQIFSRSGWDVVFVDINKDIVDEINRRGEYTVEIKDKNPEKITVKNVRAIYGEDSKKITEEISDSDLVATAVGKKALPYIMDTLAEGIILRWRRNPNRPLDIIICENIKNGAEFFRSSLLKRLPVDYPFEKLIGLVETSIGKMVPIMKHEDVKKDPLLVYAEAYNTLIVDKRGFKGPVPDIKYIEAKDNMKAWVDRKLYIHNLGHAVLAYVSNAFRKGYIYVWEAVEDSEVREATQSAMWEAGRALIGEYPEEFNEDDIKAHIDDLLARFGNKALGDTIYRVGRDLYRKLSYEDRLVGAVMLCGKHRVFPAFILLGISSAFFFNVTDENGNLFSQDERFFKELATKGYKEMIKSVCRIEDEGIILFIEDLIRKIEKSIPLCDMIEYLKNIEV